VLARVGSRYREIEALITGLTPHGARG